MSISDQINQLTLDKTAIANAIVAKNGTVNTGDGFDNFATDINTIPTGITPSGNISLTASTSSQTGIDVTNYATASVAPTPSESKTLTLGSSAPSTVSPSSGKLLSSVPVSIDSSVIKAENIADGVTMLGITGTHSGGSSLLNGSSVEDFWSGYTTNHNITIPDSTLSTANKYQYLFAGNARGGYSIVSCPSLTIVSGSYALSYFNYKGTIKSFTANSLTRISGSYAFNYAFGDSKIESLSFPSLITIDGSCAFQYCCQATQSSYANLTSINLNNLTTISGSYAFSYAFYRQANLFKNKVAHPFPKLTSISATSAFGSCFRYGEAIMYVFDKLPRIAYGAVSDYNFHFSYAFASNTWDYRTGDTEGRKSGIAFPSLTTIGYVSGTVGHSAFNYACDSSTNNCSAYFSSLTTINNRASSTTYAQFRQCGLKYVYMPKLTSIGGGYPANTFYNSTTITELHFGIENQATIEALTGYSSKFGATNATIYFSMVNHITLGGVVYDRDGPNSDFDNWYFAYTDSNGNTLYVTNPDDPAIGDTTYTRSGSAGSYVYTDTGNTIEAIA